VKLISIVSQCYNEEENIRPLFEEVKQTMAAFPDYRWEYIFIDNNSEDKTPTVLREMAQQDHNVKVIYNTRNFGQIRSPLHAMLQARGDAVISLVSDFQEPPALIADFIRKWEEGYKIVVGVKNKSEEPWLVHVIRKTYYRFIERLAEIKLAKDVTGFGLYDRDVIEMVRKIDDPYPYLRGLICDLGYERAEIRYTQPKRRSGRTKNNFFTLYDYAMLGITNHSKIPLRLAAMIGFLLSILCLLVAVGYFVYKLLFWKMFSLGLAPVVIGLFFFASVQLFFLGVIGEYIGSIYTHIKKRPLVVEKERLNFD